MGREQHPSGSVEESLLFERIGELPYMAVKRQEGIAYIHRRPGAYAFRTMRHVALMWTGFWSFRPRYLRQEPLDPENICVLSLISILSVAGLYGMLCNGRSTVAALYLLVLLAFPIPYYLSHLDPGFRHPLDPLLVILTCSTISSFKWART